MLCKKCQKEKSKEEFKKYDYGWRFVYSGCCNECKKGIVKRKKLNYKERNKGAGMWRSHPELFCKRCCIKLKTETELKDKLCSGCIKII